MSGHVQSSPWACTFWLRNGSFVKPTQSDFAAVVASFYSVWLNSLAHQGAIDLKSELCTGLYYDAQGEAIGATAAAQGTGNQGGDPCPANVALCIGWGLNVHYRGGHPRTYLAGQPESQLENNTTWKANYTSATQDLANEFHRQVNLIQHGEFGDAHLGTVSFQLRREWRDQPIFRDFVPYLARVDSRVDSQRRRLGRDRV